MSVSKSNSNLFKKEKIKLNEIQFQESNILTLGCTELELEDAISS